MEYEYTLTGVWRGLPPDLGLKDMDLEGAI